MNRLISRISFLTFLCFLTWGVSSVFFSKPALAEDLILKPVGSQAFTRVVKRDQPFNTILLTFEDEIEGLMMNANPGRSDDWQPVEVHDDGFGADAVIFIQPTNEIQFKQASHIEGEIRFNAEFLSFKSDHYNPERYSGPQLALSPSQVISRSDWGADESLRYWTPELIEAYRDKPKTTSDPCADIKKNFKGEVAIAKTIKFDANGEFIWPLYYTDSLKKIVVHHTDSELRDLNGDARMDGRDYQAMLQAIYYYHTVRRGWGDIGYHYVIDPLGNVYQGRAGGDKVIGAHALCHNNGSLGIAIIGDYENNNIPEPAMQALIRLVAEKSDEYNIDPKGNSYFRGKNLPNIIGHRDVRATACPGKKLYASLPRVRELAALTIKSSGFSESKLDIKNLDYNAEYVGSSIDLSFLPNQKKKVVLSFKNTGKETWDQNTWLHVALNNDKGSRVVPIISDKLFVAADMKESSVGPGQTGRFEVELQAGFYGGYHQFALAPVVNGRYKISRASTFARMNISDPTLDYEVVSESLPSGSFFQGEKIQASIRLKNTGNVTWVNYGHNPIRLGTEARRDRKSVLVDSTRLAHLLESEVDPGKVGTFIFDLEVPTSLEGRLRERFAPVIEHVSWMKDKDMMFEIDIKEPRHLARIADKTEVNELLPGEQKRIELVFENRGDLSWNPENMRVGLIPAGLTLFKNVMRPASEVKPGNQVGLSFWVQAPYESGQHRVSFTSRFNQKRIRGGSSRFLIDVPEVRLGARKVYQNEKSMTIQPNEEVELEVHYKNVSNAVWQKRGKNAIYLAPSKPNDRKSRLFYEEGWVTRFRAAQMEEDQVYPGEIATFKFKIKPQSKGVYRENFQLVVERVGWIETSLVRWDLRVFGKRKTNRSTSENTDIDVNQERAKANIARQQVIDEISTRDANEKQSSVEEKSLVKVPSFNDPFRVMISYNDVSSKLTANTDFLITDGDNQMLFEGRAGQLVAVDRNNNRLRAEFDKNTKSSNVIRFVPKNNGIVEINSMERRPEWNKSLNDNQFRGIMELRIDGGKVIFINELPLEDYMKGLAEVSNDTLTEKQKAIAVLARSYARFYMSDDHRKFPGKPYDGSDDPAIFQRYLGYGVEKRSPNFVQAVKQTEGEVVTYQGELIKTPYFNQSDGRTRSAEEVWGWKNTPYLQSVDDPYCEGLILRGHGVGMSGCGSDGMAKAGKTFKQIIEYYYKGVDIETIDN